LSKETDPKDLLVKIAKIELENGISVAIREDQLPLTIGRAKD